MQYLKKMCILRQIKQGFTGDGKPLSGLVKIEQYGRNIAIEVSIIHFAPTVLGDYYCLLADSYGNTELLPLRGKSMFNILSNMDISLGFCAVVCFVNQDVLPIAYGVNGDKHYDWKRILSSALPTLFPKTDTAYAFTQEEAEKEQTEPKNELAQSEISEAMPPPSSAKQTGQVYDDETVASENYYIKGEENERKQLEENAENANAEARVQEQEKVGADAPQNGDADGVLHAFETQSAGYYHSVKRELDTLMQTYPKDDTLKEAFSCSEWVRVKGEEGAAQYLVGVLYQDGTPKYVCYALAAEDKNQPPAEIAEVCQFVPSSLFDNDKGFFVIFQSAATGECVLPKKS